VARAQKGSRYGRTSQGDEAAPRQLPRHQTSFIGSRFLVAMPFRVEYLRVGPLSSRELRDLGG